MEINILPGFCMALECADIYLHAINYENYKGIKRRLLMKYCAKYNEESKERFHRMMDGLETIYQKISEEINREDEELNFFFKKHRYKDNHVSIAHVMLLNFGSIHETEIKDYAKVCKERCRAIQKEYIRLRDISYSGLSFESDGVDTPLYEHLFSDIDLLSCDEKLKWNLYKVCSDFDSYMDRLVSILEEIDPVVRKELVVFEKTTHVHSGHWTTSEISKIVLSIAEKIGVKEEEVMSKTISIRFLYFPCDRMMMDELWSEKELPLFLGLSVEWDDYYDGSQIKKELLCEEMQALSEASKFEILQLLQNESYYGGELAGMMNLDAATVSRHINVLLRYNLLYLERKEGRNLYYRTNQEEIRNIIELITKVFLK